LAVDVGSLVVNIEQVASGKDSILDVSDSRYVFAQEQA